MNEKAYKSLSVKKTDSEEQYLYAYFLFRNLTGENMVLSKSSAKKFCSTEGIQLKKISTISLVNVGIETRVRANNESRVIKYRIKCVHRSEICQGVFCYLNIENEQFKIRSIVRIRAPPTI